MASNLITFTSRAFCTSSLVPFSPNDIFLVNCGSKISENSSTKGCFNVGLLSASSNPIEKARLYLMNPTKIKLKPMGFDYFAIPALPDGGIGGNGGVGGYNDGNSGGKGEDDNKNENGGNSSSFVSWYLLALENYPVLTKALTSALLNCIGDLICQLLIDRVPTWDFKRTFLFTFLGFILVGPTLHFWYSHLSHLVTISGASGAFLRLLLDQFLFSPIFIGVFLSTLLTLEGRSSQVVPKLRQEWLPSVLANWQLWIPFQFLNFRFVPQQLQVLAANVVALAWNVILSYISHRKIALK